MPKTANIGRSARRILRSFGRVIPNRTTNTMKANSTRNSASVDGASSLNAAFAMTPPTPNVAAAASANP